MREKINKITVSTRITIPLRDILELEAEEQGLSFCSYLEQLILERNNVEKSDTILAKEVAIETVNNNPPLELQNVESDALKSQLANLKAIYLDYQKRSIRKQKEAESELTDFEMENYDLTATVKKLEGKIALLQQYDVETESLQFLQERFPDLSKTTIIKTCLDCCAENEGHWLFLYRFSDYLKLEKSFEIE